MMDSSNRFPFAIYKIGNDSEISNNLVQHLIEIGYSEISCFSQLKRLFIYKGEAEDPAWLAFIKQLTPEPEIDNLKTLRPSFVLLILSQKDYYAVAGGSGASHIRNFVNADFGLDVSSRLLLPQKIKRLSQMNLSGELDQIERSFRDTYDYQFDTSNWGKLTKEILGPLKREVLNHTFALKGGNRKSTKITGRSSIKIGRSITPDELDQIIDNIHKVEQKPQQIDIFSGYQPVKNKAVFNKLENVFLSKLNQQFQTFVKNPTSFVESNIYITFSNLREILSCDEHYISLNAESGKQRIDDFTLWSIFNAFMNQNISEIKRSFLSNCHLLAIDLENSNEEIQEKVIKVLHGEINYKDRLYFRVDGKWYLISNKFQTEINQRTAKLLEKYKPAKPILPNWSHKDGPITEPQYIRNVCRKKQFVQMHDAHVHFQSGKNRAELCDIVLLEDPVNFIFLKRGLGGTLRELFAQVRNSIDLFQKDAKFRKAAILKIKNQARFKSPNFKLDNFRVVIGILNTKKNPGKSKLHEKLSGLAKLDFISTANHLITELSSDRIIVEEIVREPLTRQS